jgi:hypothetical protein
MNRYSHPSRRDLLKALPLVGIPYFPWALGGTRSPYFLFHIHCGSWDSWASGLLQPETPGTWPTGIFQPGKDIQNPNPLLNKHTAVGSFVFHNYSMPLAPIANDLCLAMGNSQSVGHDEAFIYQTTGQRIFGPQGQPQMTSLVAQKMQGGPVVLNVNNSRQTNCFTKLTPDVQTISALNITDLKNGFKEDPRIQNKNFSQNILSLYKKSASSTLFQQMTKAISNLENGLQSEPMWTDVQNSLLKSDIKKIIDQCEDSKGISDYATDALLDSFQMAAFLAQEGSFPGFFLEMPNHDFHGGGSAVDTARLAAATWAHVQLFWQFIKKRNLQDRVLVVCTQEFARSPFKSENRTVVLGMNSGEQIPIQCPGSDHHPVFGMLALGGQVPKGGRIGGIAGTYVPTGSKDLKGQANSNFEAYTTQRVMGSLFLRCFPQLFPNPGELRKYWSRFQDEEVIPFVVA